ncbi:MAG TPA: glycosyltransferase family 39 protein [Vicinamibacterales bacterium]|nr:glycosyltransferase family 39 protein [Vicinamibacterales bacterium]
MTTRLVVALSALLLLLVRLPSLVQPMGADQGLYAYVGDRIRAGQLPYRDAWDQKPPAIHYTYAALRTATPSDAAIPAADLIAAAAVAWLLYRLGASLTSPGAGALSALLFLLLSNPAFTRLAGVRLRAQCETFIAVAIAAAILLLARSGGTRSTARSVAAGAFFGVAFLFKYNAVVYVAAGLVTLWIWRRLTVRDVQAIGAGFLVPVAATLGIFAYGGSLRAMYDATVLYNMQYSGETYGGLAHFLRYLATFPIQQARVDALWTLGGAGCLILLPASLAQRDRLVPIVWVAAACLSIAINGSRGLPQYFVQANPALALAAGCAGALMWQRFRSTLGRMARAAAAAGVLVILVAVWRVNQFPKLIEQTVFDSRHALGWTERMEYLARYADDRKYSALAAARLGELMRARSGPQDSVYVFGFSPAAYVHASRPSASRFFWSRPVIVQFNAGRPGYGSAGLLADLSFAAPAVVALQRHDWYPDVQDSADFFLATAALADWLHTNYVRADGPDEFDVWVRRHPRP